MHLCSVYVSLSSCLSDQVLYKNILSLYSFLCVRLCGTRCAVSQRARVLRGRKGSTRYMHSRRIATMMTSRTSTSRLPAISMPTRMPTRKQMTPKAIWRFVIGILLSDLMLGNRPSIRYASSRWCNSLSIPYPIKEDKCSSRAKIRLNSGVWIIGHYGKMFSQY